jgi:hypothetical protein
VICMRCKSFHLITIKPFCDPVEVYIHGRGGAKYHDIPGQGLPQCDMLEHRSKRAQNEFEAVVIHLIGMEPLRQDATVA